MRGAVALCLLAAFGAAAWAEADPRFQPMDQFVVIPQN